MVNSAPIGATTRTKPPSSGYPVKIKYVDFMSRGTHRLRVTLTTDKSQIHAEFPDHLGPATPSPPWWADSLCPFLPREHSWSVYWDASWRTIHPPTSVSKALVMVGGLCVSRPISQTGAPALLRFASRSPPLCRLAAARRIWRNYWQYMQGCTSYTPLSSGAPSIRTASLRSIRSLADGPRAELSRTSAPP